MEHEVEILDDIVLRCSSTRVPSGESRRQGFILGSILETLFMNISTMDVSESTAL